VGKARIDLVLTVIGLDRPGLVELLSKTVTGHQGNWESSRMARMAGRFAGILQVSVAPEQADRLSAALAELEGQGLRVVVERAAVEPAAAAPPSATHGLRVELVGNDRPGVIRDVSSALADRGLNVEELATRDVSAEALRQVLEGRAPDFMVEVVRLGDPDRESRS